MSERVARKAKTLFDAKEKVKHRFAAFESILGKIIGVNGLFMYLLELLPTIDGRTAFFKEHLHDLIAFALDSFYFFGEKLETNREYREKVEKAIEREGLAGLTDFFFFPKVFELIMTYVPDLLNASLDSPMVVNCVRRMMMPGSHRVLRREGLRLLLIWMKFGFREDTRHLFISCVDLTQFNADPSIKLTVSEFPSSGHPLVRSNLSLIKQAEDMFEDILYMVTYDQDANRACIQAVYKEFRKAYLAVLYPNVFREYRLVKQEAGGYTQGCPQRLQVILLKYLAIWLLPESSASHHPISSFIFVDILLSSPVDSEIVHEILRQALLLPWEQAPSIKAAMALLKWWVFQAPRRRPAFLQEDLHEVLGEDSTEPTEDVLIELYVDRYIRRVASLFDGRPSFGAEAGQFECYREAVSFMRGIGLGLHFTVSPKIWHSLITTALSVIRSHLLAGSSKAEQIIGIPEHAQAFAALIVETLVGFLVRSGTKAAGHWEGVCQVLRQATRWAPVVTEWSRTAALLAGLFIEDSFTVAEDSKPLRRPSNLPKYYRIASVEDLTAVLLDEPDLPDTRDADDPFLDWKPQARPAIAFLWRNWLRVLGDLCGIEVPGNHELAIRTLASILERLCDVHDAQPCDAQAPPPLFEFVGALLDACDVTAKGFEQSRCIAIAALAKLLCRRPDVAVPKALYDRFYLALVNGLADKDSPVALVVLRASSHIFSFNLPGSMLLIPSYLRCIASILNAPLASQDVFVTILRLVTSIALLPDIFPSLLAPRVEAPLPIMSGMPVVAAGEVCLEDVRAQVQYFVALTANHLRDAPATTDPLIFSQLVCSTLVLLLNELAAAPARDEALVEAYLGLILHCLDHQAEPSVSLLSAIEGFTQAFPLEIFSEQIQLSLTRSLIACLSRLLDSKHPDQDDVVPMVHALLGWVMALPSGWLLVNEDVCRSLFEALFGVLQNGGPIADAGKHMLSHLMAHLEHCCPLEPYSGEDDPAATRQVYYGLGSAAILCVEEIGVTESTGLVRVTSRTPAGKFSWEFEAFYDTARTEPISNWSLDGVVDQLSLANAVLVESLEPYLPAELAARPSGKAAANARPKHQAPRFTESTNLESTDMLADLLAYLEEEFPEMEDPKAAAGADFVPPSIRDEVAAVEEQCRTLVEAERALSQSYSAALTASATKETPFRHRIAMPAPFQANPTPFQYCRQLVLQCGLLGLDEHGRFPVKVLSPSAALQRELRALDGRGGPRETAKIGLIYVAPGCETEASILSTQEASESYRDFCEALGSYVSLSSHRGFTGGLEPSMTVDGKALYYSTSILEAVFHEPARMAPPSPDDTQPLLAKKRHVGNDPVHIVWNEHWRPYKPSTIPGDFGNYQIVITPTPDLGLYAVNIYADDHFPTAKMGIGPLFDGALIPRALLAPLVRATAISADRLIALEASGGITPALDRKACLQAVIAKYGCTQWGIEKVLSHAAFGEACASANAGVAEPVAPSVAVAAE